jgi:Prokaryotic E2 family C/ThiF family
VSLADYYSRAAMAASQVLANFDQSAFMGRLEESTVGIQFGLGAIASPEARALLDLLVRLLARLYPRLVLHCIAADTTIVTELVELAIRTNPNVDIAEHGTATIWINVGDDVAIREGIAINVGCSEWTALVSTRKPQPVGESHNPFGAGAAACIAAANLFRWTFVDPIPDVLDLDLQMSTWRLASHKPKSIPSAILDLTLVGAGAIGNSAAWALARLPTSGSVRLIDPEAVELSNLQRYILALREDIDQPKIVVASRYFTGPMRAEPRQSSWAEFVASTGVVPDRVLVAVDSSEDRRAIQASLPRWIANAWTQPGDLGVSVHEFLGQGACLRCLYLPVGEAPSQDALLAEGLRVPDQLMRIRELLYHGDGAPADLLELIASRFGVSVELLQPYEGVTLSRLYSEGICGGAILPLGAVGAIEDVHVPLAHQSALAGVLLAAAGVVDACGWTNRASCATRLNLMRPIDPTFITQSIQKDPRRICICQDRDYQEAYRMKYPVAGRRASRPAKHR